jgi:hypothetical protein
MHSAFISCRTEDCNCLIGSHTDFEAVGGTGGRSGSGCRAVVERRGLGGCIEWVFSRSRGSFAGTNDRGSC